MCWLQVSFYVVSFLLLDIFHYANDIFLVVQIFKGKCGIRNCYCNSAIKLLEHGMKFVEMVLEKCIVEK